ncbi:unnamed protein product [Vitrella brassicaformis CCMP3155]|uniref:LamG-like jellyroll fold domain-containing protein n=1 Tax=Vitrella brassicaformis (strain CCMP3155) TaxID=1169540 RepID=A0A0G4GTX8_VITBC|nr:unnamed protein product [Vitrella brassicaformis CCMP3155]|mmetsp:Transcript_49665/g.124588  ORF Transcript_49665/g.124588 Transcript_49665/m.124588 type:complete len:375 (-) Transcript_49665:231-1355(-)|eukprot:CEM34073.1 unnamed protein product [Vitrella brassicaformis CCMP3155]
MGVFNTLTVLFLSASLTGGSAKLFAQNTVAGRTHDGSRRMNDIISQCFDVPQAFCLHGTSQVITAAAIPNGLVGWWTFDDVYPIDHSGHFNHMHPALRSGPSFFGYGASLIMDKDNGTVVASSPSLNVGTLTVSFWIYLLNGPTGQYRYVVSKGHGDFEVTPTVLLQESSNKLRVRVSTNINPNEGLDSQGGIPMRRWTHVAVSLSKGVMRLFIDGMLDSEVILSDEPKANNGPLFIGKHPHRTFPGFDGYIDDIKFYNYGLQQQSIQAMLPAALTGIGTADFYHLGRLRCTFNETADPEICPPAFHLCTLEELYMGGFHTARTHQWLITNDVWYKGVESTTGEKSAVCCRDADEQSGLVFAAQSIAHSSAEIM